MKVPAAGWPWHRAAAAALLLLFVGMGLWNLDRWPKVHEDESWQAAPGYTFWTEGRFGTDLFRGFSGMERHYYGFMPLFPLMLGGSLKLFGFGLLQARFVPLGLAALTLLLTYLLGERLFSPAHGLVALLVLATWPLAMPEAHLTTGLPLADLARICRYDIAVPVFGLLALLALVAALEPGRKRSRAWLAVAGVLSALATLSHVYGAAWLVVVLVTWSFRPFKDRLRTCMWALAGFSLTLLPYLLFIASGWEDFLAQNRNYAQRFALGDAGFYLTNLLHEPRRYHHLTAALGNGNLVAWLFLAAFVTGLVVPDRKVGGATVPRPPILRIALFVPALLFGLLLESKNPMYLATLWPLAGLVASTGVVRAFPSRGRLGALAVVVVVSLASLHGLRLFARRAREATAATSFRAFTQAVSARIPGGGEVLGMQHYWLGLGTRFPRYRAFHVALFLSSPRYVPDPRPFSESVRSLNTDVVFLDETLLRFLRDSDDPRHEFAWLGAQIREFLAIRASLVGSGEDPTYGRFEIYRVREPTPSTPPGI